MPESSKKLAAENRRIKCCHCIAALLLLLITVVAVTLAFSVFIIKDPTVRVGKLNFDDIKVIGGANVTLNVGVSVKNPNFASFNYGNMTTTFFYRGAVIADLRGPPGRVKARRTVRVNVTMDIMEDRILSQPGLEGDINSGLINVTSFTRVSGRMHFIIFEKQIRMNMKCNISFNITSREIQHHKCKRKINF